MEYSSSFTPPPSSSSSYFPAGVDCPSTSSSSMMPAREEDSSPPDLVRQPSSPRYLGFYYSSSDDHGGDDTFSCLIVILTFWFFVSMTLIMGIFGSEDLETGPYSSILLQPNPLFVRQLKVEYLKEPEMAPVLYGFYRAPPLDVTQKWSETLYASVKPESHEEWVYFLNEGSQINISYNVPTSSSLLLIVAKGVEEMAEWIEDPSYPDVTLSWNVVHGNGTIVQDIPKSNDYYVAVGNLNSEDVKVELQLSVKSSMYDTTNSYYKCNLTRGSCNLKIPFPSGIAAVLTTPGTQQGGDKVFVKLSYEPRWLTYFLGIGGMTSIMLWAFNYLKGLRRSDGDVGEADTGPERAPLLSHKDEDLFSLGSSYDSGSQNDDEAQEYLEDGLLEGRPAGESGKKYNSRQCVICFDASKDCFFIPCGHCACCFDCGTRIAEDAGICPICRRKIKKVRRIYNV
ncbi:E3 ubiquitin-protein ligase APD2 [Silene latifolia]|uniref:E3 ubiquitin-protein ligase APD2 n=1 Tax=Silene latifolia TaxID=37657 RepID=UPI003D7742E9